MAACNNPTCFVSAHNINVTPKIHCHIFTFPEFEGMLCYKTVHTLIMNGFFMPSKSKNQRYSIKGTHPIYTKLQALYNLPTKITKKKVAAEKEMNADDSGSETGTNNSSSSSDNMDTDTSSDDEVENEIMKTMV